jgi:hypothetical protein
MVGDGWVASGAVSTVMRQWSWSCGRSGHAVSLERAPVGVAVEVHLHGVMDDVVGS